MTTRGAQQGHLGPSQGRDNHQGPPAHPYPLQTHMLCRTHQPQWGSREPRHSSHDVYCTQLSTGTRVTWQEGTLWQASTKPIPGTPTNFTSSAQPCAP